MKRIFTIILLLCSLNVFSQVYVKWDASGANDGSSWTNAYTSLQDALTATSSGEIWVAVGIYYPDAGTGLTDNDRTLSFNLKSGLALYGGFAGIETALSQRDWKANVTTLSGDLKQDDGAGFANNGENAYHVVWTEGVDNTAVLDGFTITAGNANGSDPDSKGAGMYNNNAGSPTVSHCTFTGNAAAYGGGMYNNDSALPTVTNCSFSANSATNDGGGIYNFISSPTITNSLFSGNTAYSGGAIYNFIYSSPTLANCSFSGNTADGEGGGIYNNDHSSPTLTNCSFSGNTAYNGGAIYNDSSSPTLTNCSFSGNRANRGGGGICNYAYNSGSYSATLVNCSFSMNRAAGGGGIYNDGASSTLTNCILWGDIGGEILNESSTSAPSVTWSIVWVSTGVYPGEGNLNQDPLFVDRAHGNLHVQPCSPAINAGLDGVNSTTEDLDGQDRVFGGATVRIDMGAYELQYDPGASTLYVNAAAGGANNGTSWANAFTRLQDALVQANACAEVTQIWVAAGTYYPDETGTINSDFRTASFALRNNLAIYGGFPASGNPVFDDRKPATYTTILSGDLKQDDGDGFANNGDNAYHVVKASGVDNTAVLGGFTIKGGNANAASAPQNQGGGMYNSNASPIITNCTFTGNNAYSYGGGIANGPGANATITHCSFIGNRSYKGGGVENYNSSPTITNCTFTENEATAGGGAIYTEAVPFQTASPTITNCRFVNNRADDYGGGIANAYRSSATITNCSFTGNTAANGGGMENYSSSPTIINCTFTGNEATGGGGMYTTNAATPTVTNCIFWDNTGGEITNSSDAGSCAVTYCIVKGGYPDGTNILDQNPLFADATTGNLDLLPCSPAINEGLDGVNTTDTDLAGKPRVFGGLSGRIDMGAYEFQYNATTSVLYVDASAGAGANNGTSWTDAFTSLQDALARTSICTGVTQIWVAKGVYYPDEGGNSTEDDRAASFMLKNGIAVYGGFASGDEVLDDRDPVANETILSGDLKQNDGPDYTTIQDNASSVVVGAYVNSTAVLDGFTIKGGNGDYGGGMYNVSSSPTISNCSFSANTAVYGGGMSNFYASSPILTNCSFTANTAVGGGGMHNFSSSPILTNCNFSANTATDGGGMHNHYLSSPTLTNCSFTANTGFDGGGMSNSSSSPILTNCSFSGNTATDEGGGMSNYGSSPTVTNCIVWGNTGGEITNSSSVPIVTYSIVKMSSGVYPGEGNLNQDPLFENAAAGDLRLKVCSPAVNAGLNSANTTGTDLAGKPRIYEGTPDPDIIDRGAYELQAEGTGTPQVSTVVPGKYTLAPPNHKMQDIALAYTVTGGCAPVTTVTVSSNEPVNGTGDGDTEPDWIVVDATHVKLRAERAAQGDGRVYTIVVTATDISGTSIDSTKVRIAHNITAPVSGASFKIGSTVAFAGTFWDKPGNRHTAKWLIDDNTIVKGTVTEPSGPKNGKVTGSYRFNTAGVYKLQMNVTDQSGVTTYANTAGDLDAIVVIYDPAGGYTYGGGWFASPQGALTANPAATGKVSYGFAVNYFKTSTYPKGETQFEFKVGELEYNALNFNYLAISGARAQFKGTGKIIGGQSGIDFIMTVIDGALDGTGVDKARIRIFNKNTGEVYYDNEPGLSEASDPKTKVGNGSTVVIKSADLRRGTVVTETENLEEVKDLELRALPNPTRGNFNVFVLSDNKKDRITLQVFDQWGRKVEQRTVAGELTRIGAAYRPGTYYIRVVQGDRHREAKVIKLAQ